jgi:hypothetical protein
MISIITTGRDDNYGKNFLDRLHTSITKNTELFLQFNIEYEYIVVEWNPINNPLYKNEKFSSFFENPNHKNIIVTQSVSEAENLSPTVFYEYFAKNVGVRNSSNDNILILNSDIIVSKECGEAIHQLYLNGLSKDKFYRARYREQLNPDLTPLNTEDCHKPHYADHVICGYYSGDFLLIHKDIFPGYDETNPHHRDDLFQTSMDGEMLWKLHKEGVNLEFIESKYSHINHGKDNPYNNHYNQDGYENKTNWGFTQYEKEYISENIIVIK